VRKENKEEGNKEESQEEEEEVRGVSSPLFSGRFLAWLWGKRLPGNPGRLPGYADIAWAKRCGQRSRDDRTVPDEAVSEKRGL